MTTLTINLLYEEIIMLQDIMMMLDNTGFADNLDTDERLMFNEMYEKIMEA